LVAVSFWGRQRPRPLPFSPLTLLAKPPGRHLEDKYT